MIINLKLELDDEKVIDKEMLEQLKASARKAARSAIDEEIQLEVIRVVKRNSEHTITSKVCDMLNRGKFDDKLRQLIESQLVEGETRQIILNRIEGILISNSRINAIIENLIKDRTSKMIAEAFRDVK